MTVAEAVAQKLEGKLKKYTIRALLKDGREIEAQADEHPRLAYNETIRECFLTFGYSDHQGVRVSELVAWTETENTIRTPETDAIP